MSVLCSLQNGWIISHELYIEKVYESTLTESVFHKYSYRQHLFEIIMPFKGEHNLRHCQNAVSSLSSRPSQLQPTNDAGAAGLPVNLTEDLDHDILKLTKKKTKRKSSVMTIATFTDAEMEELVLVEKLYLTLMDDANKFHYFTRDRSSPKIKHGNQEARKISSLFYLESSKHAKINFHGENSTDTALITLNGNEKYIFPPHSIFFCYDIKELGIRLEHQQNTYDLILLDPPWWNKYIRRKKSKCAEESYQMMYNEDLAKLPIGTLLAPAALVAVWCTNSSSHILAIQNELFPAWGIEYIGTWYWLKVTQSGEPVCPFTNPRGKQPYERIMFGRNHTESRPKPLPENGKMILSVPSAIHSQKPPLTDVLSAYLPAKPKCLELFARYLLPEWTSWGNEVLKLQHISLYKKQPETNKQNQIHE